MVIRDICKSVAHSLRRKRPHRTHKRLRKSRPKHRADTPPSNGACLLLGLPAEIRQRILEYTLCRGEPIQAQQNFKLSSGSLFTSYRCGAAPEYDQWPNGRPDLAILLTCRQMNQEGSHIFYNQNTFSITICDQGYGTFYNPDMLGMGSPMTVFNRYPKFKTCPNLRLHFLFGSMVSCTGLGYGSSKDSLDVAIEEVYQNWQGSGRLDVEVYQKGNQWATNDVGASALLHKLGLFRCKSVWFKGVPFSIAYRLTQLIESEQLVFDVQQAFRDLTTFLGTTFIHGDSHDSVHGEVYTDAERFAALYDVENFMLLRKEVIESALERMKAGFDRVQERGLEVKGETAPVRTQGDGAGELDPFAWTLAV